MKKFNHSFPSWPGSGPAIRSTIEILRFFLDGRVKHGHDNGDYLAAFRFFQCSKAGIAAAEAIEIARCLLGLRRSLASPRPKLRSGQDVWRLVLL
jgi:hypothetical protein